MGIKRSHVLDRAGGQQVDVEVDQRHREQRDPGIAGVVAVEPRHERPHPVADRVLAEVAHPAAHDVAAGVAGERVEPDVDHVDQHQQRAEAHVAPLVVGVAEGQHHVEAQHQGDQHRGVPEPAVDVVEDQRQPGLAGVAAVRLGHAAGGRAQPEGAVVGLAVVVAGHPEPEREDQDDQRRREREPRERLAEVGGTLDAVGEARRVERREVRRGVVVGTREGAPGRVDDEGAEHHEGDQRSQPPSVVAECPVTDGGPTRARHPCAHVRLSVVPSCNGSSVCPEIGRCERPHTGEFSPRSRPPRPRRASRARGW